MNLRFARDLLAAVTQKFPPGDNQHHALTFQNGSLELNLFLGEKVQGITLEESDLDRDLDSLVAEIARVMEEANDATQT